MQATLTTPKNKRIFKMRHTVIILLSVIAVAAVFWWLKLTGITMAGEAFCGMDEHTHTEQCLAEGCQIPEHTHTASCYSNPNADLESEADWKSTLKKVELSGVLPNDVINVAKTQVGYRESELNYQVDADGQRRGYTRYGQWYGNVYGDWSAMFVSFTLHYAGIPESVAPYSAGAETMRVNWETAGMYTTASGYSPREGDIIFFDKDKNGSADAVGFLYMNGAEQLMSIEGDLNDTVGMAYYSYDDSKILGYGILNEIIRKTAKPDDVEYADFLNEFMLKLPSYEEVELQLLMLESDEEAYEAYFLKISEQVKIAFMYMEDIPEYVIPLVTNSCRYNDLSWMMSSAYAQRVSGYAGIEIPQVDAYENIFQPMIIYSSGKTATAKFFMTQSSPDYVEYRFTEWTVYEVTTKTADEINSSYMTKSHYYISKIYEPGTAKNEITTLGETGFLLYVYKPSITYKIGESVTPSSHYTSGHPATDGKNFVFEPDPYDSSSPCYNFHKYAAVYLRTREDGGGLGTITVGKYWKEQSADVIVNETNKSEVYSGDLIKINLYDYTQTVGGNSVNTLGDTLYPGFQRSDVPVYNAFTGTVSIADFGFGDVVVSDFGNQIFSFNKTTTHAINVWNSVPLRGLMYTTLVEEDGIGYPAMKNGASYRSLSYLFGGKIYGSVPPYVVKKNDDNITGLFKYDGETNTYSFDSRDNHAQYLEGENRFQLYDQLITPNFVQYPYGNFMPFNNITTETTKVTDCTKAYFQQISASAWRKYFAGFNSSSLTSQQGKAGEEYKRLAQLMENFIEYMDTQNRTTAWTSDPKETLKAYEAKYGASNVTDVTDTIWKKLYNIDYDEESNFFFGMEIEFSFRQPKDGLVDGIDENGNPALVPMKFTFNGDDDVWVYIDDVLYLDLTGIHPHQGGEIDFSTGDVTYYGWGDATGKVSTTVHRTAEGVVNLEDYSQHTLKFYYMERGSGSSLCNIEFNIPLIHDNSITIEKEVDKNETNALGDPYYEFVIVSNEWVGDVRPNYLAEYVEANGPIEYEVYEGRNLVRTETTEDIIRIKAGESAVLKLPENYKYKDGTQMGYIVREIFTDEAYAQYQFPVYCTYNNSTVELPDKGKHYIDFLNKSYYFVQTGDAVTPQQSYTFTFTNTVSDPSGTLYIDKVQDEFEGFGTEFQDFTFKLTFDGKLIPRGTPYYIISGNTKTKKTVDNDNGYITITGGTKAQIDNIFAGTEVVIEEILGNDPEYTVSYISNDVTLNAENNKASFNIGTIAEVNVQATNKRIGYSFTINGEKILLNPDNLAHDYSFTLKQVALNNGFFEDVTGFTAIVANASFTAETASPQAITLTVNLPKGDYVAGQTYYFKMSEDDVTAINGKDQNFYIVAATIPASGSEVTDIKIYKNGIEESNKVDSITFTNTNVRDLTIQKVVEGVTPDSKFDFEIEALFQGQGLNGTFTCEGLDGTTQITFANGKSSFKLAHNEQIKILGLPYGAEIIVKESAAGYYTKFALDGAEAEVGIQTDFTLNDDSILVVTNVGGTELPATGTPLRNVLPFVGCGIMLLALGGAFVYRFRRNKPSTEK